MDLIREIVLYIQDYSKEQFFIDEKYPAFFILVNRLKTYEGKNIVLSMVGDANKRKWRIGPSKDEKGFFKYKFLCYS